MTDLEPTAGTGKALRYQDERGLDEVSGYATGVQLRFPDGSRTYIALSATELAIYLDTNCALHFDLAGRLQKVAEVNQSWRRSLSGRVLYSRKRAAEEGGGLDREVFPAAGCDELVAAAHRHTASVHAAMRDGTAEVEIAKPSRSAAAERIAPVLARAAAFDLPAANQDVARFHKIYGRVAVLPPDQYNALVLQATEGCAYAGCAFCDLYRGVPFHPKSVEEFRHHVVDVINYHGDALQARRSIFLGEANALTQPTSILKELLKVINEHFELPPPETPSAALGADWWMGERRRCDGVSSFLDAFTNPNRTCLDYHELRCAGLRRVYIGLETGDDGLLQWLHKPATAEAAARCVQLLKENDIAVGVIVLLGAGGRAFNAAHARETVRVLNDLPLGRHDYIYFSPLLVSPGSQYDVLAMNNAVEPLDDEAIRQQEQEIRLGLRFDQRRGRPYLARYELETFVY